MSLLRKIRGLHAGLFAGLLATLVVSGCGFEPLYSSTEGSTSPAVTEQLASVKIATIPDRSGQKLRNNLALRINPQGEPINPQYQLSVSYSRVKEDFNLRKDSTTGRSRLRMSANFTLMQGNKVLLRGSSISYSSFNVLDEQFASTIGERDAEDRGLVELSEDIRLQLAAFFKKTAARPDATP